MAATTILKAWEVVPNTDLKVIMISVPNTADQNDTVAVTLADYGIAATGLLTVEGWRHTTDGSVIVAETFTCAVSAGVLTITMTGATSNDYRLFRITGRADLGVFA